MMFLNSKKSFRSFRSEYSLRTDFEVPDIFFILQISDKPELQKDSKNSFENYRLKTKETAYSYFGFRKIPCDFFPKPLNKDMFSVFGRFIKDYLRNLTCWEKSKHTVAISCSKSIKNS
jgi:hypothetical protein